MTPWLLPAAAVAWWAGLLVGFGPASSRAWWGSAAIGLAALVAAVAVAPSVRRRDPVAERGLVPPAEHAHAIDRVSGPMRRPGRAPAVVIAALVLVGTASLGAAWGTLALRRIDASPLAALAPGTIEVEATLREDPRPGAVGWQALADVRIVRGPDGVTRSLRETVWLSGDEMPGVVARGDLLRVEGSLQVPDDPGFLEALRAKGVAVTVRVSHVERLGGSPNPFVRATQAVRRTVGRSIGSVFPPREAGLLMGLALGDDSRLDPGVERDFEATGLTHLLVVSGGNVAMVLGPILALVTMLGLPRPMQVAVGLGSVAFIVVLTGAEPSVTRAGAMSALTLVGLLLGRARSTAVALSGAVLVLTILQPVLVRSVGFQLSVAATAGMVAMAGPLGDRLGRVLPAPVAAAIGTTLSAQLGVTPVLLFYFHDVPGVTLIANVVAAPTVAPSLLLGLAAAAAGVVAEPVGRLVGLAAQVPMRALELVANVAGRAPVAHLTTRGGIAVLIVGSAIPVLVTVVLRTGWRPPRTMVVVGLAVLPLLVWGSATGVGPPSSLTVRFLDVGQGDAVLITTPDGAAVLVDAGPEEDVVATELAALGIERLDVVIETHPHADHAMGLPAVLARVQVGLYLYPGCSERRGSVGAAVDRAIVDEGIETMVARAGDSLTVGDLALRVLAPPGCPPGADGTNDDSVAVMATLGADTVLLTGDAERAAQAAMLTTGITGADVLKVPHHAGDTSLDAFFEATRSTLAVISVGRDNTYGHPTPEVLAALRATGARIVRTDQLGTITVTFDDGAPVVTADG